MGLLSNVSTPSGIVVNGAYARVSNVSGSKASVGIMLEYFISQAAQLEGKQAFHQEYYNFEPEVLDVSTNIFKQSYVYLKTLDGFKSAIDVLEVGQTA